LQDPDRSDSMKKERLQTESDRGSQSHDHDASIGFVVAEDPLPAKALPSVKRMTEKRQDVELYAETVQREADQQRRKQIDYGKKLSHDPVFTAFLKLRIGERSSRRTGINKPHAPMI